MLMQVGLFGRACKLPLLVDVDTGFGSAFGIARTVRG